MNDEPWYTFTLSICCCIIDNVGKGPVLRPVVFDYLGGSNYLAPGHKPPRQKLPKICLVKVYQ